jgi:hypothetical protein
VVGLLNFFLSAAAVFGKLLGWLSDQDRQSRERIAGYFDQIAECMQEVAERIENGDPPRDTCRRLAVYASELQQILDDRRSPIASNDASIEATRQRLVEEIRETESAWYSAGLAMERRMEITEKVNLVAAAGSPPSPSESKADALADQFEQELTDQTDRRKSVQKIWDASGEFRALADALRAR